MPRDRLVVVGASLAGLRAVESARKAGFEGSITLIGAERHLPYDRPPLSKVYLEGANDADLLDPPTFRGATVLRDELGVRVLLGTPATGLNTERRVIRVGNREIGYDKAVITTGAEARRLPGMEGLAGVHTLRTFDDAVTVRDAMDAGARTVVVGAGFIGSEVASSARKRGRAVTVVEAERTPLVRAVGEQMGEVCASLHRRNGTDLRCGVGITGVRGNGRVEQVLLTDGSVLDADLVVIGVGADPAIAWLVDSGLHLDDGVVCDEALFTGVDGVYAAGDIARWRNPMFEGAMRLEHWSSAADQGAIAARNAVIPSRAKPYATVPYFWSDWYDSRIQFAGVSQADEVRVVEGDPTGRRYVALYRQADRLTGAMTINGQSLIMKYRGMIMKKLGWNEALEFAGRGGAS